MHHTGIDTVGGTVTARGEVQRGRAAERAVQRGHGAAVYPQEAIIRCSVMELWPVRRWRTVRGLRCL